MGEGRVRVKLAGRMAPSVSPPGFTANSIALLNRFGLQQDLVVPEPHHSKSFSCQPSRTLSIILSLAHVLAPIQLNNQPPLKRHKVHDVPSQEGLPAELPTGKQAVTEQSPQDTLGVGRVSSEAARPR